MASSHLQPQGQLETPLQSIAMMPRVPRPFEDPYSEQRSTTYRMNMKCPPGNCFWLILKWDATTSSQNDDVKNLYDTVVKKYRHDAVIAEISSSDEQEHVLDPKIYTHLERFMSKEDSTLILYYAGHGSADEDENNSLRLSADGRPTIGPRFRDIAGQLMKCARGNVLIILDCSHAGLGYTDVEQLRLDTTRPPCRFRRLELIAACAADTTASSSPNSLTNNFSQAMREALKHEQAINSWSLFCRAEQLMTTSTPEPPQAGPPTCYGINIDSPTPIHAEASTGRRKKTHHIPLAARR